MRPILVVATLLLSACGGWGSAYTASVQLAEATCERAFDCASVYPEASVVSHEERFGLTVEGCVQRLGPDPALRDRWDDAEDAGTVLYESSLAKDCAIDIGVQTCDGFFADPPPNSCDNAVVGTLALDAACRLDAECASGLCQDARCAGTSE